MPERFVCITGATGFVGWHTARAFCDAGWKVAGIVRPDSQRPLPQGVGRVEARLETESLTAAAAGASVIVHAAGLTGAPTEADLDTVNVKGTAAALEAASAVGAHLVFVSSQAATGVGTILRPSREDDDLKPINAYGRSKVAAEATIRSSARTGWTILRPSSVYGPTDLQFLPLFRLAARGWFPLITDPQMAFTLVHVSDVARAIVLAAERPATNAVMFIGHPEPVTAEGLLRGLADACGRSYRPTRVSRVIVDTLALAGELGRRVGWAAPIHRERLVELRAEGFVCATDRASELLGFSAQTGLQEGLAQTLQWYRDRSWV